MSEEAQDEVWQAEADLLADGREWLERQCKHWRLRHLFPGGADLALLLRAYQDLDRLQQTRPERYPTARRRRRALRRLITQRVREEALARDRRLHWHYPLPRTQRLANPPPPMVQLALATVDDDARAEVRRHVTGGGVVDDDSASLSGSMARVSRVEARVERGLRQFGNALFNAALSSPRQIRTLHPQYISFLESTQPTKTAHPVATLLLVKLPARVLATLLIVFTTIYVGAWAVLNHRSLDDGELLAGILTDKLGGFLAGGLEFEHVNFDLDLLPSIFIPGRKAHLRVRGVDVYAPGEPLGLDQRQHIAHADEMDLELDLLEIIPWNRLGVPRRLEIPWLLHFGKVETHGDFWLEVHQHTVPGEEHPRYGLVEAFQVAGDMAQPEGVRTIGIRLDELEGHDVRFVLDFDAASRWKTELWFEDLTAELDFEGHFPELPQAPVIPLAWSAVGTGGRGTVDASGQHLELSELELSHAGTGREQTPMGDMRVTGTGTIYRSPARFDGFLRRLLDRERPVSLAYEITTPDAGDVVRYFVPEPEDGAPPAVVADGARAMVSATGAADDPTVRLVAQGLQLNLLPEPAWAFDDVDVSLSLARDPVAEKWDEDRPEPSPSQATDERWQVRFETFRGAALDGDMRLGSTGGENVIVLPGGRGDPLLLSLAIALDGVNPGQLVPHDPRRAAMLAGAAEGVIEVNKLILEDGGRGGFRRTEVRLHDIRVRRDRGPEVDRLPRQLRADGEVFYGVDEGLDLRALRVSTDGGTVNASGGVSADWDTLKNGAINVNVSDGKAFLNAFGLDHYFDRLELDLGFRGSTGAPSGDEGRLAVDGLKVGNLLLSDLTDARIWLDRGVLRIRAADARLLGGHGPLEVDVVLFERGKLASDPKIRLFADLSDMDRERVFGAPVTARGAEVRLFVDDGAGGPVRLSEFQARGAAYADRLELGPSVFRDATTQFAFTDEGLRVDSLHLNYHRPLSPLHAPQTTVATGHLSAVGLVRFDEDTWLDLDVNARGIPLSAVTGLVGADFPVRGQIARGTQLHVEGMPRRPQVTGLIALDSLSAANVPLGSGELMVSTADVEATSELAAHRVVSLEGDLTGGPNARDRLDWSLAAYVAFPEASVRGLSPEARIDVDVTSLPVANLLAAPDRRQLAETLAGQLNGLRVDATYCANAEAFTPECAGRRDVAPGLEVAMGLDRLWVGPRRDPAQGRHPRVAATGDPCDDPLTICSAEPLRAHFADNLVELDSPLKLRSGGRDGSELAIAGSFDLAAPPERSRSRPRSCDERSEIPPPPPGRGLATAQGRFDFKALATLIESIGVESPSGALDIAVQLSGLAQAPSVTGIVELPPDVEAVTLRWQDETLEEAKVRGRRKPNVVPVALESLWLEIDAGRLFVDGDVRIFDEILSIHGRPDVERERTHLTLGGPCQGDYALSADGALDGKLIAALVPDLITASTGRARLDRLDARGHLSIGGGASSVADGPSEGPRGGPDAAGDRGEEAASDPNELIERLAAELSLGRDAALSLRTEIDRFSVRSGKIEIQRCRPDARCPAPLDASDVVGVFFGGRLGSTAGNRPRDAISVKVGRRGAADAWGWVSLTPDLSALGSASMNAKLDRVPYTQLDNSGSPELEVALSSPRLSLRADEFGGLSLEGRVLVEKSRWLRNANVSTSVLSFSDPVPAPPSQLHPTLRDLALSLDVRTTAPFRADINVIHDLEASAEVSVDGTVGAPEFTGSVIIERGEIDIPIIGEPYEISRGRIVVDRNIRNSRLDVSAVGLEPKLIDNQLKTVTLNVQGPLDSITWSCSTLGDVSGALSTTRGCTEYILFGAGDAEIAQTDVSRAGAGGNLVGRPLTLVGNLTEVTLNDYLEDEAPRLEAYTPEVSARVEQLGFAVKMETKPEWIDFGGANINFGVNYLRGYPGGLLRDSTKFYGRFEILDHSALEFSAGRRNFTQRQLVLDPPVYSGIEFVQSYRIPSRR